MTELAFHPLADVFPLIEGAEFDELVASIKEHGLRHPITTLDDMILDGRNRYRACLAAGVAPLLEPFKGRDPIAFVIDENVHRRHLSESQRAMVAARIATLDVGQRTSNMPIGTFTQPGAAKALNVGRRSVVRATKIIDYGTPEQIAAVVRGEVSVTAMEQQVQPSPEAMAKKAARPIDRNPAGSSSRRADTLRRNGQIWGQLRDAINNLTSLPMPSDVVAIARGNDRSKILDTKLTSALNWLKDFNDVYHGNRSADAA